MDKELLYDLCLFSENHTEAELTLYLDLFGDECLIQLFSQFPMASSAEIPDQLMQSILDIKSKNATFKKIISEKALHHFEMNIGAGEYRIEQKYAQQYPTDRLEATRAHFNIFDSSHAFDTLMIQYVVLSLKGTKDTADVFITLDFDVPWEEEHGCKMLFKNGEFVGYE